MFKVIYNPLHLVAIPTVNCGVAFGYVTTIWLGGGDITHLVLPKGHISFGYQKQTRAYRSEELVFSNDCLLKEAFIFVSLWVEFCIFEVKYVCISWWNDEI